MPDAAIRNIRRERIPTACRASLGMTKFILQYQKGVWKIHTPFIGYLLIGYFLILHQGSRFLRKLLLQRALRQEPQPLLP